MKWYFLQLFTIVFSQSLFAQAPGSLFDKKWHRNGRSEMAYYYLQNGGNTEICTFRIDVSQHNNQLVVYTMLSFTGTNDKWADTSISDWKTLTPVYRASHNKDREYALRYGKEVSGYYLDKKTRQRHQVTEPVVNNFVDSYTYPYLLGMLPLASGYKTDFAVYDYKQGSKSNVKKVKVVEVRSNTYESPVTGSHKVWQGSVVEEATGDTYDYYIDKDNRRIWKIDLVSGGKQFPLLDKETDYNPFTATFDKDATMKMITTGNSVITGQVFARDNQAPIKGIAVLNINKRQYASKGTSVVLIPYTAYFKEWLKLNKKSRKTGRAIPLPKDVADCMKVTGVYDDEGHFEFVNLQPGEYLLYTEFEYVHQATQTEVVGYTDTYINGMFQGTSANTVSHDIAVSAKATVQEVVTIKKNGDKATVKLKKTR